MKGERKQAFAALSGVRTFQANGTASTKALMRKCDLPGVLVVSKVEPPVELEKRKHGKQQIRRQKR